MTNITVRNIPDEIMDKIKTLSKIERRSINNEILIVLEKGLLQETSKLNDNNRIISNETQLKIWQKLCGSWEDNRSTEEIIKDIISKRSNGREIEL